MREGSPASRRSSALFGIHSESKAMESMERLKTARAQSRRFTYIAATAIFLLVTALICLIVFDMYNNRQTLATRESRSGVENLSNLAAHHWRSVEDVELATPLEGNELTSEEILKENDEMDRKWTNNDEEQKNLTNHANHRYTEEPADLPEERFGGTPRPFTFNLDSTINDQQKRTHDEGPTLYGFQNAFHSWPQRTPEPSTAPPEDLRPVKNHHAFILPKKTKKPTFPGFKPPMQFKGVYIHPKDKEPAEDGERNEEYYKKINDYFGRLRNQKNLSDDDYVDDEAEDASEKQSASNLELERHEMRGAVRKPWVGTGKNKPFTVMMDIYPMEKEEPSQSMVDGSFYRPKDTIYIPVQNSGQFLQHKGAASNQAIRYIPAQPSPPKYLTPIVLPSKKKGRMVMKLNLFPKKQPQRRTWDMMPSRQEDYEDNDDIDYNDIDDVGEDDDHHCNGIVGHNPYGKPITAKWKDEHGHLIHAKYIALKQWDRTDDDDDDYVDPR